MADDVSFPIADGTIVAAALVSGKYYQRIALVSVEPTPATATIAINASLSGAVDLVLARLIQIQMPAAWDAAVLTFQTSQDNVTYTDLYDSTGAEYTIQAVANRSITIPRDDFCGTRYLKVRSGPSASAVNQTTARTITLGLV